MQYRVARSRAVDAIFRAMLYTMTMNNPTLPKPYRVDSFADPETSRRALDRIWDASLLENDEETSHVLPLADPWHNPERNGVLQAWVVHDEDYNSDVAMAIVVGADEDSNGRPILNMFVSPDHRNRGIGKALLELVLQAQPEVCGYYSSTSARLFHRHQMPCAWPAPRDELFRRIAPANIPSLTGTDKLTPNQRTHVALVLAGIEEAEQGRPARVPSHAGPR